jgi:peptidoglycan LD-endopeptidase CwlK
MAKMTFKLSKRSNDNLIGVNPLLITVVRRAIEITTVDFGVIEGVRTQARQRELVSKGASQTMNSKHITGDAVDLAAFIGPRLSWELPLYAEIAEAMRIAAKENNARIRWGAAWNVNDIRNWKDTMADAMDYYVSERRKQNRRPFIDGPHFELV